jgi:hypothetical protein
MSQIFFSQIEAAKELTGGSTYKLAKLREAGILDSPIDVPGFLHRQYTYEQIRMAKNRAARLAYAPTTDIKQVVLKPGERLA